MITVQKRRVLLAIVSFSVLSIGIQVVYAETHPDTPQFTGGLEYVIAFGSFIVAGVFYSSSGWIKRVRRKLADDTVSIDYKKMGKSVLIGVILGVGAMVFSIYDGNPIVINNAQEFLVQVGLNTAVILLIDKWILGRAGSNGTPDVGTGDVDDEDLTIDDIPEEVPPGKDGEQLAATTAPTGVDPNQMFFRADPRSEPKTINGNEVVLVATQPSRRRKRKGRTNYIYHIKATNVIVYNRSRDGILFMRMAIRPQNVSRYYDVFVRPPLSDKEKEWLERYDYILVSQ